MTAAIVVALITAVLASTAGYLVGQRHTRSIRERAIRRAVYSDFSARIALFSPSTAQRIDMLFDSPDRFITELRNLAPNYFWTRGVEIAIGNGELLTLLARLLDLGTLRITHRDDRTYLNSTALTSRESRVIGLIDAARVIAQTGAQSDDGGADDREASAPLLRPGGGCMAQSAEAPAGGAGTPPSSPSFDLFFVTELSSNNEHFDDTTIVTATRESPFEPTGTLKFETSDRNWCIGDEIAVRTERVESDD